MSDQEEKAGNERPSPSSGGGPFYPAALVCALLEITDRRLRQLVEEGWIPRAAHGQYSLRDSVRGYIKFLKQATRESSRGSEGARLAAAQATKVELENWRRLGELQTTSQVDETTQGLVVMMKSAHDSLPGRLASELAAISEPSAVFQRLKIELGTIVNQCADFLEKRAAALEAMPEPGEDAAAVDTTDPDDVGGTESSDAPG